MDDDATQDADHDGDERLSDGQPSALVQEAACAERVVVLKVRVPGRTSLIIVGATRAGLLAAGLISNEDRRGIWGGRLPPGAARQRAREDALTHARVLAIGPSEVFIDQHGDPRVVRAVGGRVVVTDEPALQAALKTHLDFIQLTDDQRRNLEERGHEILQAIATDAVESRRTEVAKVLDRAQQKIERRRAAIANDLDKIAQADRIASQAQWLVAEAARAPRGATKLVVTDWSSGEAVAIVVPLDPSKSAKDQVAAMFKRAKRLRLGARIAEDRLAQAKLQSTSIAAIQLRIVDAETTKTLPELEEALREAKSAAPRDVALPSSAMGAAAAPKKKGEKVRTPFRTFFARSGRKILVGKGAADNDTLTLHVARPHDLWLHAKDHTGAHVVVMLDKNQACSSEDLVDAAHLAAHFSDVREEKIADVQYTDRRYVRKPKGSPAGAVMVDREKVLVLRVEPEILRGLLEREEV